MDSAELSERRRCWTRRQVLLELKEDALGVGLELGCFFKDGMAGRGDRTRRIGHIVCHIRDKNDVCDGELGTGNKLIALPLSLKSAQVCLAKFVELGTDAFTVVLNGCSLFLVC